MSITVVIPTRNRKDNFLFTALESVKRQTSLHIVDRILVSENGTNKASQEICNKFPELKIEYVRQSPELTQVEHLHWLMRQSKSKYIAMLHDDDWWYPTHLETALRELTMPSASCYFSNYILSYNEILKDSFLHYPSFFSFLKGNAPALNAIEFSFKDIVTLCYLYTPFSMSTMVCKSDIMKAMSEQTLPISKPFYADRILYPYIALYGNIRFSVQPLCSVRLHETSVSNAITNQEKRTSHIEGSNLIRELGFKQNVDVIASWSEIKTAINGKDWELVENAHNYYLGRDLNEKSCFYTPGQRLALQGKIFKLLNFFLRRDFKK